MIWIDWIILALLLMSMVTAFLRGAVREVIGLIAWIAGAYLAFKYTPNLQHLLDKLVTTAEFRYVIMFLSILIIFLVLGAIGGKLMGKAVSTIGLSGLDRLLGVFFGLARGLLLVVIFIMLANFTPMVNNAAFDKSWFIAQLNAPAEQLMAYIQKSGFIPDTQTQTQQR